MVHWGNENIMPYVLNFKKGSPHVHSFTWIFNAPNIESRFGFNEKTINPQLPNYLNNPEIFELVKTYQVHAHSRTCWKYNKDECRFFYGRYFTEKIIVKPFDSKFSNDEKQKILTWRNSLLRQVSRFIDNNLNPARVNVIDPTKDNFTQPLSVKEISDESEISKEDYYKTLSISKDEDLELLRLALLIITFPLD